MKNILILEDVSNIQWNYLHAFSKQYYVFPCQTFTSAEKTFDLFPIDVCIIDIYLDSDQPDENGISFIKKIKEEYGYKGKIILVTGFYTDYIIMDIKDYIDVIFKKPVEIKEIKRWLKDNL